MNIKFTKKILQVGERKKSKKLHKDKHEQTNDRLIKIVSRGGFGGGGGGGGGGAGGRTPSPPQGFEPLRTQRVHPLVLFKKSIFGRPTLKFF